MWVFFTLSGLWGVGDAVWQTQINGIYGALFRRNKEAAFSNYRLWESAGFVIAYAYSTTLCARMKLYVMISVMILGIFGWIVVEIKHWRKEMRLKKLEEQAKNPTPNPPIVPEISETDDERDELEEDIVVTHL
uniref:Uncharacterized protein n=2 Tax=Lutzomyia longipalpis TaxID=7200 RepID=A0A7G3B7M5_LUTLO